MSIRHTKGPYRAAFAAMSVALLVACSGQNGPKVEVDPKVTSAATLEAAMQADRDYAAMAAKDGLSAAATRFIDFPNAERYVAGKAIKGAEFASFFASAPQGLKIDWTPDGGHASASGDLAVTTGRYSASVDGKALGGGRYVSVWRKDKAGAWKISMDADVADPGGAPVNTAPTPDKPDFEGRPG